MKYIIEDLKKIYIRAKDKDNSWATINLTDIDDLQFKHWLRDKLINANFAPNIVKVLENYVLTPEMRLETINEMDKLGFNFVKLK